jgi:hypothetical protein
MIERETVWSQEPVFKDCMQYPLVKCWNIYAFSYFLLRYGDYERMRK